MPNLNGFNLLKQVKAKSVLTQVVILSAQPTSNALQSSFALGANEYLTKPIVREELIDTTRYLIAQSKRWRKYLIADLASSGR
jgi:two-component system response regulator CiaR